MVSLEDLVKFITCDLPSDGTTSSPGTQPARLQPHRDQAQKKANDSDSSEYENTASLTRLPAAVITHPGGTSRDDERRLPRRISLRARRLTVRFLASVFFDVMEPIKGLDRHPAIKDLLESFLSVSRHCPHEGLIWVMHFENGRQYQNTVALWKYEAYA